MVVTRSRTQATKKKFTDDDFIDEELSTQPDKVEESEEEESESESDDEAPEEESTNKAKEDILLKQKQRQDEEARLKKQEKEKRKALDLRNKQQQEISKKKTTTKPTLELPEFLPDDIESIMNGKDNDIEPKSKHIRLDEDDDIKLDRKSILEEKLRQLKQKKKTSIKKGPVFVKIQSNSNKKVVPKSESKIVKNKSKWLNRKSINRK
ncbi:BUD21 Bud site selection protein 21 [Candida maltosa Xu316]|uniref:Uncharacterized protein n=1 Tax=Candida maltosa (strain Xu316) TaxID=1245528 RepID=M3J0F0_CANMX|nr:hypothetical protein G210_4493 [Candida maltosa Xu316]